MESNGRSSDISTITVNLYFFIFDIVLMENYCNVFTAGNQMNQFVLVDELDRLEDRRLQNGHGRSK